MSEGKLGDGKMSDELAELDEFEEVEKVGLEKKPEDNAGAERPKGNKPDYRILQPDTDANGKSILKSVGAMWKSTSRDGREYFVMKIGELRLLVFPNNK